MTVIAIIAEYNPMHTGHVYQINRIRQIHEDAYIIVVMSGHFCQRGGACIYDKWTRASIAISNGVDLVIQLPEFYSTQSGSIFANGAISLLNNLDAVDYLYFSTDTYSCEELVDIYHKQYLKKDSLNLYIKNYLSQGYSYPRAVSAANQKLGISNIGMSNDILGFEYIKSLIQTHSSITPKNILRVGNSYNDQSISSDYPSATTLRRLISLGDIKNSYKYLAKDDRFTKDFILSNAKFNQDFFDIIKYSLSSKIQTHTLDKIYEIDEGLDYKIAKEYLSSSTINHLISKLKSKRYTHTKISRILFNCLLNITKDCMSHIIDSRFYCPYARVLAFNNKGRAILSKVKKTSSIPIITKITNFKTYDIYSQTFLQKDLYSTDIYNIIKHSQHYSDYYTSPVYIKS